MLKNRRSKIILKISTFILTLIPIFFIISSIIANNHSEIITIYHTNDMHSRLESKYTPDGKLVQIGADILKTVKDSTPNSILIDAGDCTQGTLLGSHSRGNDIINLMNLAGYDIMIPGNHEFDYGIDSLKENIKSANFPIISANLLNNDKSPFLKSDKSNGCNIIKNINNKKIGFFALTTSTTKYQTNPDNIEGIVFEDELITAKKQVQYLKNQKVDAIVGITHIGNTESIIKEIPDIDIMIDGHSHEEYTKTLGKTVIQQTGSLSKKLGKIEIQFGPKGISKINPQIIDAENLLNPSNNLIIQYMPNYDIEKFCQEKLNNINRTYNTVAGKITTTLYGGDYEKISINRLQDTNLGNLIGDSLIFEARELLKKYNINDKIDIVSIQNGGGIRTSILGGVVSYGDVLNVSPFDNNIIIKEVTPKNIYQILENGVKSIYFKDNILQGTDGAFPNVGGMRFEFDINEKPTKFNEEKNKIISHGNRVKKVVLINKDGTDKKILDRNDDKTKIALASNNFTTSGGDQYIMIKDLKSIHENESILHDVILNYIKHITINHSSSVNYYSKDSRCKIINEEDMFGNFDATIVIKDDSVILNNKLVKIKIDDNTPFETVSDSNGIVKIQNLSPGSHDISIKCGEFIANFYVNNKIGITSPNVILINETQKNIKDVINIIGDIRNQPYQNINLYISFARKSYNLLSDYEKSQIYNYNTLLLYEKNSNSKSVYDIKKEKITLILNNKLYIYSFIIFTVLIAWYTTSKIYKKLLFSGNYKDIFYK